MYSDNTIDSDTDDHLGIHQTLTHHIHISMYAKLSTYHLVLLREKHLLLPLAAGITNKPTKTEQTPLPNFGATPVTADSIHGRPAADKERHVSFKLLATLEGTSP